MLMLYSPEDRVKSVFIANYSYHRVGELVTIPTYLGLTRLHTANQPCQSFCPLSIVTEDFDCPGSTSFGQRK